MQLLNNSTAKNHPRRLRDRSLVPTSYRRASCLAYKLSAFPSPIANNILAGHACPTRPDGTQHEVPGRRPGPPVAETQVHLGRADRLNSGPHALPKSDGPQADAKSCPVKRPYRLPWLPAAPYSLWRSLAQGSGQARPDCSPSLMGPLPAANELPEVFRV